MNIYVHIIGTRSYKYFFGCSIYIFTLWPIDIHTRRGNERKRGQKGVRVSWRTNTLAQVQTEVPERLLSTDVAKSRPPERLCSFRLLNDNSLRFRFLALSLFWMETRIESARGIKIRVHFVKENLRYGYVLGVLSCWVWTFWMVCSSIKFV